MRKNKQSNLSLDHWSAIKLSIFINLLLFIFVFIGYIFSENNALPTNQEPVMGSILHFSFSIFISYLLFEYCFWAFRKKWGTRKKMFIALFGTLGLSIVISFAYSNLATYFLHDVSNQFFVSTLIKNLVMSLIIYLVTQFIATTIQNQKISLENQTLLAENMRNRYEALKNQLNPHFLFNTLNTLDGLIGFDDEKAHYYLQNLSSSFRYTIQNKEITSLKEELDFVKSYAHLMKIRYGDNLSIQYNIDKKYCDFLIMPISLQLLIENAVKHNIINDKLPLTIFIETTENDTIKVSNTIQPKINAETGEGVGLANLVERYNLLFHKEVLITQNGVFGVEIPLIEQINDNLI
ncbi:MAG: histidine kinase [Tannerella sp.]|jgi:sensor histidine kinase YesM|nr:histidine kinase [Tannerella sp.]